MNVARKTILVDGLPVHYEVAGEGEPLIFIHGLSESTRVWYRNVPILARHYHVYLVDLPGFGAMRGSRKQFSLDQCAIWLERWMQVVGIETAHLVGHSMGGYVALALVALHPEKIKHLVLVSSVGIPLRCSANHLIYPALRAIGRTTPLFWPCILYDYMRAGPAMVWQAARQIVALEELVDLSKASVPILLIWGSEDDLVPLALGHQLHLHLTGSHLFILPGANHFCMFERPYDFTTALLAFLQDQEVGRQAVGVPLSSQM